MKVQVQVQDQDRGRPATTSTRARHQSLPQTPKGFVSIPSPTPKSNRRLTSPHLAKKVLSSSTSSSLLLILEVTQLQWGHGRCETTASLGGLFLYLAQPSSGLQFLISPAHIPVRRQYPNQPLPSPVPQGEAHSSSLETKASVSAPFLLGFTFPFESWVQRMGCFLMG